MEAASRAVQYHAYTVGGSIASATIGTLKLSISWVGAFARTL